jgi:hypothetical protein
MARSKATISVDRDKLDRARDVTGARSASEAIDIALDELLRFDRLRRDTAAYAATPPTDEEIALARATPDWSILADDTDWEALYSDNTDAT